MRLLENFCEEFGAPAESAEGWRVRAERWWPPQKHSPEPRLEKAEEAAAIQLQEPRELGLLECGGVF